MAFCSLLRRLALPRWSAQRALSHCLHWQQRRAVPAQRCETHVLRRICAIVAIASMLGGFGAYASAQAGAIEVRSAQLEADRNGWALDAHFYFTLNEHLAEAVNKGIPLYFTTGFTLTRARWYWFDERAVSVER